MFKKKKYLFSFLGIICLIIITTTISINSDNKTTMKKILKSNNYRVTQEIKKGTKNENYTYTADCTIYEKDSVTVYIYQYENHEQVRNTIMTAHEQEKPLMTEFIDKDNYIRTELCYNESTCSIRVGINNIYLSSLFEPKEFEKVKKVIDEIVENELK